MIILIWGQITRHLLTKVFHLSNLLQMLNDHRMVNVEFFDSFSYSCKRISSLMIAVNWLLSTSRGQPLHSSSSRLSFALRNFLNHHWPVSLLAVPGPNMLLMLQVVSAALWPILNSNKKIADKACRWQHPYGKKRRGTKESVDEDEKGEWKSWLKTQHSKNEDHSIWSHHFMANRWGNSGNSDRIYFLGL